MLYQVKVFSKTGKVKKIIPPSKLSYIEDQELSTNRRIAKSKSIKIFCEICGDPVRVQHENHTTCKKKACNKKKKYNLENIKRLIRRLIRISY